MKFSAQDIAKATHGTLHNTGAIGAICTDTRAITPGDWFLALQGERFDAHDFLDQAIQAGASGVIAERVPKNWASGYVQVGDSLTALQDLGRHVRASFDGPVVGITGSTGKTTTRAMIGLALGGLGKVHQTQGNFNNHIGLPLTLLDMPPHTDALVLEMGMNHAGEIALLAEIGHPTIRIITNVGAAHLEGLGTIAAVASAKAELFDAAQPGDICCINTDDPHVANMTIPEGVNVFRYGTGNAAQLKMCAASVDPDTLTTHFKVTYKDEVFDGFIPSPGLHMAHNAVAALAVGLAAGLALKPMLKSIEHYAPVGMRLRVEDGPMDTRVINDAYNANPMSMAANLSTLAAIPAGPRRRRVALLGDMLELGETAVAQHRDIAKLAASLKLDLVGFVGPLFKQAINDGSLWAADASSLSTQIKTRLQAGDIILIKGSRGMRMERVLDGLKFTEKP
jgi:UDP-N-acetylmuramoyl-tripeptide--D-alanyl-D-alanine ligase